MALFEDALESLGLGELGMAGQIGVLEVNPAGVEEQLVFEWVQAVSLVSPVKPHILLACHLTEKVVLRIRVQGGNGSLRAEPPVNVNIVDIGVTRVAVLWYFYVLPELLYLG